MMHAKSIHAGLLALSGRQRFTAAFLTTAGLCAIAAAGQETPAKPLVQESPKVEAPKAVPGPKGSAKQESEPAQKPATKKDKSLRELDPFGGTGPPSGAGGGEEEMKELFIKVDKRLQRVSELLFEASTGDNSRSSEIGAAGIDELIRDAESASGAGATGIAQILEATRSQSEAAQTEIDRILEIAAQSSPSSSGAGSEPPPPSSGMPKQGQTPSGSKREEKGKAPTPGGEQPGQKQPQPGGEEPNGGQEQEGSENGPGKQPAKGAKDEASSNDGAEAWGDLPVHLRKTFQNGVSDDVPPRYRDWVDSYYKRLNRRSGK